MTFHPSILALLLSSGMITVMVWLAAGFGLHIVRHWDLKSGSERQLTLERRTYLVSSLLSYAFVFQIASLFLFIYTSDTLSPYLLGSMCAAGTLGATPYGYWTLGLKTLNGLLGGLWLLMNHCDNRGEDYPLIKPKYRMLAVVAPLFGLEAVLQAAHFTGINADIITSCCGSLFSRESQGIAAELTGVPAGPMMVVFYGAILVTLAIGARYYLSRRGGYLFSAISTATTLISLVALFSFICLYYYESPTHYCPFCILREEYSYVGYVFYTAVFAGGLAGVGVGVLKRFSHFSSIAGTIAVMQRRLTVIGMTGFGLVGALALYPVLFKDFVLLI